MTENEITKHIMSAAFRIHRTGGTMKKLVATLRRSVKHLNLTTVWGRGVILLNITWRRGVKHLNLTKRRDDAT
jgi:hypothetical protein